MKNIDILKKMIETLEKLARAGKDREETRRLLKNLREIYAMAKDNKIADKFLSPLTAKQTLQSCLSNSVKLLIEWEKIKNKMDLHTAPISWADEIRDSKWTEDI